MTQKNWIALSFLALTSAAALPQARADMPPPADYVENCTLEKQQVSGKSCVSCSSYYATVDKCKDEYSGQGYSQACKSWGASVWTEIWCQGGINGGTGGAPNNGTAGAPNLATGGAPIAAQAGSPSAGSSAAPIPEQGGTSSGTTDTTIPSTGGSRTDTSSVVTSGIGGATLGVGGNASTTASPEAKDTGSSHDDGGCAVSPHSTRSGVAAQFAISTLAALMLRRRRRMGRQR